MSSTSLSLIALASTFGGILLGVFLRSMLPSQYLSGDAKDVIRLGAGLIGTVAALVLGLLVASAKTSYDGQAHSIRQITATTILLDLTLAEYGGEVKEARELLRRSVSELVHRIWNSAEDLSAPFKPTLEGELTFRKIQELSPDSGVKRSLQPRLVQLITELVEIRLQLFTQRSNSIPLPFYMVLVFWLSLLFGSYSLFAPPNPVIIGALLLFALSASGALYLILEMTQPFSGLMRIPSEPLQHALVPL